MRLTTLEPHHHEDMGPNGSWMTWSEVIKLLENRGALKFHTTPNFSCALNALIDAEKRSKEEADTSSNEKGRCNSIKELLQRAPNLLREGNRYIGFVGGQRALNNASVGDLEKRYHYKFSDHQANSNWIPLRSLIARYLELKEDESAPIGNWSVS